MKKNDLSVSLIIPCYNEEANIQKGVLDKIGNYTKNDKRFQEVLIVDRQIPQSKLFEIDT
jgi:glycosyltransferase involved in cell wall biosynthesis